MTIDQQFMMLVADVIIPEDITLSPSHEISVSVFLQRKIVHVTLKNVQLVLFYLLVSSL